MKIKTSELQGTALDWAVAKCEGYTRDIDIRPLPKRFNYSDCWTKTGPIIEQEGVCLLYMVNYWKAGICDSRTMELIDNQLGETPLVAAMRCYVAYRLGDSVDIPDDLV